MGIIDVLYTLEDRFEKYSTTADQIIKFVDWLKHYGYLAKQGALTPEDVVDAIRSVQSVFGTLKVFEPCSPNRGYSCDQSVPTS